MLSHKHLLGLENFPREDIQNIIDRDNIWAIMYLEDGTTEMSYQYKQMPVFGITIEF